MDDDDSTDTLHACAAQAWSACDAAAAYARAGLSPILTRADKSPFSELWSGGTAAPARNRITSPQYTRALYALHPDAGVGIVGGRVSGNLVITDLDRPKIWPAYFARLTEAVPKITSAPIVETPHGGRHIYKRCIESVGGNLKLAMYRAPSGEFKVVLETRAEGGYALCPPSSGYALLAGSFTSIPILSHEELVATYAVASEFDERPAENGCNRTNGASISTGSIGTKNGNRPGDALNASRIPWSAILRPFGWRCAYRLGETEYWTRPGKARGVSATTNHAGCDLLYVFSTNANPFSSGRGFTKFAAYTYLRHKGDFAAAARTLRQWGFGR